LLGVISLVKKLL